MNSLNQFKNNPFFKDMFRKFELVRDNQTVANGLEGFFCGKEYPSSIQMETDVIINDGDCLVDAKTSNKYFIDNVTPLGSDSYILHYLTPSQAAQLQPSPINIGEIHGNAIVGSQANATIYIGNSFEDIRKYIDTASVSEQDREDLQKLVNAVEAAMDNDMSLSKGIFQKYSRLLEKHEPIIAAIAQPVIQWLLGK